MGTIYLNARETDIVASAFSRKRGRFVPGIGLIVEGDDGDASERLAVRTAIREDRPAALQCLWQNGCGPDRTVTAFTPDKPCVCLPNDAPAANDAPLPQLSFAILCGSAKVIEAMVREGRCDLSGVLMEKPRRIYQARFRTNDQLWIAHARAHDCFPWTGLYTTVEPEAQKIMLATRTLTVAELSPLELARVNGRPRFDRFLRWQAELQQELRMTMEHDNTLPCRHIDGSNRLAAHQTMM